MTKPKTAARVTDKAFRITLLVKGADGLLEILGGLLLLVIKPDQLNHLTGLIARHELSTESSDVIANHILKSANHITSGSLIFGAVYLLSHGIVKVILVAEVLRRRLWAYQGLIIVTVAFIIYQVYRLSQKLTLGFILLTLFDFLVIYLTQRDYRKQRELLKTIKPQAKRS
jgi:uncharacterized membrane protein